MVPLKIHQTSCRKCPKIAVTTQDWLIFSAASCNAWMWTTSALGKHRLTLVSWHRSLGPDREEEPENCPQKTSFCTRWPANLWAWGIWTLKQTHVEVLNSNDFQQRLSSVSYDPKLDNLMTKFSTKDVFEMVLARHLWAQTSVFSSISSWCLSPANTLGDDAIK